jgi:hypothetical protein
MNKKFLTELKRVSKEMSDLVQTGETDQVKEAGDLTLQFLNALSPDEQASILITLVLLLTSLGEADANYLLSHRSAVVTARHIEHVVNEAFESMDMNMIRAAVWALAEPLLTGNPELGVMGNA